MKPLFFVCSMLFFISSSKLEALEAIKFHITTIDGEDLSNVSIRIIEDPSQDKFTTEDGLCTIYSKTEKFQDIGVVLFKKGWTVVKPKLGNYLRIDYREKIRVIEIQMQQNEEIYQLNKNIQTPPYTLSKSSFTDNYEHLSNSNGQKTQNIKIQIKASDSPIKSNLIETWEQTLAFKIVEQFLIGSKYPYKYRIEIIVPDRISAINLLSVIQKAGFKDAFIIQE